MTQKSVKVILYHINIFIVNCDVILSDSITLLART